MPDETPPHPHPNIAGREAELHALADSVRRLIQMTVTNEASARETARMAERINALADEYEATIPATPPPRYAMGDGPRNAEHIFPYDVMLGRYNPLALPIEMTWDGERAMGAATFTTPYEGPPGCVHGAVLAGAFDQVFNVANIMSGTAGPTRTLSLRYRRPTPLHQPLEFEAWVEESDERSVVSKGVVRHAGKVTVAGEGHFALLTPERLGAMRERAARD